MHLETIWSVDTRQEHSLRILHRNVPVRDVADARHKQDMIGRIILLADGTLIHQAPDGRTEEIDAGDVVIEEFTRPFEERGEAFIPDMSTESGRARMAATRSDPRYRATDADYAVIDIALSDLAAIPGAAGSLASVAFDIR